MRQCSVTWARPEGCLARWGASGPDPSSPERRVRRRFPCLRHPALSIRPILLHVDDTRVLCLQNIGSPTPFDLTVLDGEIVRTGASFEVEKFTPEMWEPFEAWVSEADSEDATAMYEDETHTRVRLSEESVRLWKRHVREYVQEMQA